MTPKHKDTSNQQHPILLFDGVCNLCDYFVQFVLLRDPKGQFRFASLQSEIAQELLAQHQFSTQDLSTVILIEQGRVYTHSDVALRTVRYFGGLWPLLAVFQYVPKVLRDAVYNWIAANRYRWFGKKKSCLMPQPEWQDRFLDAKA